MRCGGGDDCLMVTDLYVASAHNSNIKLMIIPLFGIIYNIYHLHSISEK